MKNRNASFGMEWVTLLSAAFLKSYKTIKSGKSLNLTYFLSTFSILALMLTTEASATKYYLSPTGSDANTGSISSPFLTINKAWTLVNPGDTIWMRGGQYLYNDMQFLSNKSGTSTNFIKILAYTGEQPVISPSTAYNGYMGSSYHYAGIYIQNVNYLYVKGLEITGYKDLTTAITQFWSLWAQNVNHCKFERLNVHHNALGIFLNGALDDNTLLNCDSHHNSDPLHAYESGDGIGIHSTVATSANYLIGCRSWWNTDDGFDCLSNEGIVNYTECWSWNNGYRPGVNPGDPDLLTAGGNGQGFKLGVTAGDYSTTIKRTLKNCLSYHNRSCGFDQNYAKCAMALYNCTAYANEVRGFNFSCFHGEYNAQLNPNSLDLHIPHVFQNDISYANTGASEPIALLTNYATVNHNTFKYEAYSGYTFGHGVPATGITLTDADFASVSPTGIDGARQTDGSLPLISFMHLAAGSELIDAGISVGVAYLGTAPDICTFEYSSGGTNQAPVIVSQSFSVSENTANGVTVGTVVATDPNAGQVLTYSILSGNTNNAFTINASSGVLVVANSAALNYEAITTFALVVKVQDNGSGSLSSQATVTVNVVNVNEPPVIANQVFSVAENSAIATVVGTVAASDPDAGQSLTYSILSGNTGSGFAINSATGILTVAASSALNFETYPVFSLVIKVQDNGTAAMSNQATVTVNLTNVNEAPVIQNQSFPVTENAAVGSVVGTVIASDPDAGQTLAYSILSGNTNNAFSINASTGTINVANSSALNFETNPSFVLVVRVLDNGSNPLSSQANVSISLTNQNEAPVLNDQVMSVTELSPVGTIVGTVVATDPDAGQTLTFSLISGNSGSAFSLNSSTGVLTVANPTALNMQVYPVFNLTVRATDNGSGNLYDNGIVTINVLQAGNLPPVILSQTFTVAEHSPNGTVAGVVVASDPNPGQALTYTILSGNTQNAFAIGSTSGILTIADSSRVNYETLSSYSLVIKVQDNGSTPMSNQAVDTESVLDINEKPVIQNQNFTVTEQAPNGTVVGTVIASDLDLGQTLTYAIIAGNINNGFAINPSSGVITVSNSAALVYQTIPMFSLTVRVTDNGSGPLQSDAIIKISLLPVQTNHSPSLANQTFNIYENIPNGSLVGTILATDPDPGQTLVYSLVSGNTNGAFAVNSSNGNLTVANSSALNFESQLSFSLTVSVQDNGTGLLSSQATILVNLMDVNEPPLISAQNFTVVEFSTNGTMLGRVVASDPDGGQTLSYTIVSGNTGSAFSINSSTGYLSVANSTAISYTTTPQFNLVVKVQDNGPGSLASQANVAIVVQQGNNQPPVIANQAFSVNENSANGVCVGTVVASDPNTGQAITYSIQSGNTSNAFAINASNGTLTVANTAALNYEATPVFVLVVKVQDNGPGLLSATANITVNLINVNEYPVVANQSFTVNEFASKGTVVGTVIASDPDAGQTLFYSITAGNTSSAFMITSNSGVIKVNKPSAINYTLHPVFNLTVRVRDNGAGQLASYATMTIHVIRAKSGQMVDIISTPPDTVTVGTTYTYQVAGFSLNNSLLHFSADQMPSWLSLKDNNDGTAILEGVPVEQDQGNADVTLKVTDGENESVQVFSILVTKGLRPVENPEKGIQMSVYPNPVGAERILHLSFTDQPDGQLVISVFDMSGRQVVSRNISAQGIINLDVHDLPPAMYQVRVSNAGFHLVQKFLVQ